MNPIVRHMKRLRRLAYASRLLVPGLREQHRIEVMVGPLGVWNVCREYQIGCLRRLGLQPHHHLADIGCGPLQGGVAFIRYLDPGGYVGIDINPEKLDAAYRQIGIHGLSRKKPTLLLSESFGAEELGARVLDYFWVSQILYWFDADDVRRLLKVVREHSHEGSVFYGDFLGPEHYEHATHEYGMVLHTVESLTEIAEPMGFSVESVGRIADYGYPRRLSLHTNILVKISRAR